jgi:hypothetical protein
MLSGNPDPAFRAGVVCFLEQQVQQILFAPFWSPFVSESYGKVFGSGEEIEFEGQVYHLTPFTYDRRGEFESYCKRKARAEVSQLLEEVKEGNARMQEYQEFRDEVNRQIASGYYDAGQPGFTTREGTMDGKTYELWLCFRVKHPKITYETVERLLQTKLQEVLDAEKEANRDPNRQAVTEKQETSPKDVSARAK